jgi:hypothetical protein
MGFSGFKQLFSESHFPEFLQNHQVGDKAIFNVAIFQVFASDLSQDHYISGNFSVGLGDQNSPMTLFASLSHLRNVCIDNIRARWPAEIEASLEILQLDYALTQSIQIFVFVKLANVHDRDT